MKKLIQLIGMQALLSISLYLNPNPQYNQSPIIVNFDLTGFIERVIRKELQRVIKKKIDKMIDSQTNKYENSH